MPYILPRTMYALGPYKPPQMQTAWLSTTNVSLALLSLIACLLFGFVIYVITRMWEEWDWRPRILGLSGLATMAALALLTANEISEDSFREHFLSDFIVAVTLFVITFLAVEQFLEAQRNRVASSHYLRAIAQEL
jgi:hypothetical protein